MNKYKCCITGQMFDQSDLRSTHNGEWVSREYSELNGRVIEGLWYPADQVVEARGRTGIRTWVPRTAARSCAYDGVLSVNGCYVEDYGWVSRYSLFNSCEFSTCEDCGAWFLNVHLNDDSLCTSCQRARDDDDSSIIHDCDYKQYPSALGKGPLFYGVELEVECDGVDRRDAAERTLDSLGSGFVCLKDDGSLDDGFEIVTAPATISEHVKRWPGFLNDSRATRGLLSWDRTSCGMHVHVSRKALTQLQIGKMLVMVNQPHWTNFITDMAGREPNSYCSRNPKKVSDGAKYPSDRYQAINLRREHTIEFRLFKGSLNWSRVRGNLEFVDACVAYTSPSVAGMRELDNLNQFTSFVAKQRKRWPALFDRLVKHQYVKVKPKKVAAELAPA